MDYKFAVFIGRFQPFHNAHLEVVKYGLSIAENVIIVIGSSNAAPNIKNPWTFQQRKEMILSCFSKPEQSKIHIEGVRDYYYNDNYWVTDIQNKTSKYINEGDSVALLGNFKDSSSYYLKYFPQWEFTPVRTTTNLNSTDVRDSLFLQTDWWSQFGILPSPVSKWIKKNYIEPDGFVDKSTGYQNLVKEFEFIGNYKTQWEASPFPPTFVTVDAVVICSGHVLVVKRKFNPGKDLLALPGGFVRQSERLEDAALRELKEETGIRVDKLILASSLVDTNVFDHPDRSLRGRTITHGYYIRLKEGILPEVKGNDDASKSFWLPLMDVGRLENQFYEDHAHIINYFINKG